MRARSRLLSLAPLLASLVMGCASSTNKPAAEPASTTTSSTAVANADDGLDAMTDEQLVRKLLDVTGAAKLGQQMSDNMLDTFRKMPNLPHGFIDKFKANMHTDDLIELIVPIYLKHYDRGMLLAALRFYQSDAGRKIIAQLPIVTAESMEAGKVWGKRLAEKTLSDLGIAHGS